MQAKYFILKMFSLYENLLIILVSSYVWLQANCNPLPQKEIENNNIDVVQGWDYNTLAGHFKDFFMYLPIMFTSLKETMNGFPKMAEGIKILTSQAEQLPSNSDIFDDNECKCNSHVTQQNANNIENDNLYN
ncbi:uncharacterized protein ACN2A1_005071 [Glossina fuscipes fuscipes]